MSHTSHTTASCEVENRPKYTFDDPNDVPFGEITGYAPGGIPAYSNKNCHFFSGERHVEQSTFYGYKFQCVEFARRWLLARKGIMLPDVGWAAHIIDLTEYKWAETGESVSVKPIANGTEVKPEPDALIIYPSTEDNRVGHVGVITKVGENCIHVCDENYCFHRWESDYAYKLTLKHEAGVWTIVHDHDTTTANPVGWVTFPNIPNRAPDAPPIRLHPSLTFSTPSRQAMRRVTFRPKSLPSSNWLDESNPAERVFIELYGKDLARARLNELRVSYYSVNMELHLMFVAVSNQLHAMFLEATAEVIASDELLRVFAIPEKHWARMRHCWNYQRTYISGRFDLAFDNDTGALKCFEYNADSAATLLECGRIQQKWGDALNLCGPHSRMLGSYMFDRLVDAWRRSGAKGRVHFCVDAVREEHYTALFALEAAEKAGLEGRLCVMFDEFHFDASGRVVDRDEVPVRAMWKTWNWDSIFSDYDAAEKERGANWQPGPTDTVRLCDLFLGPDWDVLVFEPIWKAIPGNKAILPLIYRNHPSHPALLPTSFEPTEEMRSGGYAQKPIVGFVGRNVTLIDQDGSVSAQSTGKYGSRDMIYQKLFRLTRYDGYYPIIGAWIIGDSYSGIGIREDKGMITGSESPFAAVLVNFGDEDEEAINEEDAAAAATRNNSPREASKDSSDRGDGDDGGDDEKLRELPINECDTTNK